MVDLNLQVNHDNDDAHEQGSSGLNATDTTIKMTSYTNAANDNYRCGSGVFDSVTIPQGATIDAAYVSIYIYSQTYDDWNGVIYCHDVDDSDDFVTDTDLIARARTTASTNWTADAIAGAGIGWYDTPSLVDPVQEVISRPSWSSGNSLCVLFISNVAALKYLRPRSFNVSGGTLAFKLHVEYTPGWAGGDVNGVAIGTIKNIHGVALSAIKKVNGV